MLGKYWIWVLNKRVQTVNTLLLLMVNSRYVESYCCNESLTWLRFYIHLHFGLNLCQKCSSWYFQQHHLPKLSYKFSEELKQCFPLTSCTVTSCSLRGPKAKERSWKCVGISWGKCISFPEAGVGSDGSGVISTTPKPLPLTCHFSSGRLDTPCRNTSYCGHPVSHQQVCKSRLMRILWAKVFQAQKDK